MSGCSRISDKMAFLLTEVRRRYGLESLVSISFLILRVEEMWALAVRVCEMNANFCRPRLESKILRTFHMIRFQYKIKVF